MRWSCSECVGAAVSAFELQEVRWSCRECVGAAGSALELQGVRWSFVVLR